MRFDQPVGTTTDRESNAWSGGWWDAAPYGTEYNNGQYHTGADLNLNAYADTGKPAYASAGGVVTYAGQLSGWNGHTVIVEHVLEDGTMRWTRYSHMSANLSVAVNARVSRGAELGVIGDYPPAGGAGDHLHFDVAKVNLRQKPGDWPGTDQSRVFRDYEDPKAWINSHRQDLSQVTGAFARDVFGRRYLIPWMGDARWPQYPPSAEDDQDLLDMYRRRNNFTLGASHDDGGLDVVTRDGRKGTVDIELWGWPADNAVRNEFKGFYTTYYSHARVSFREYDEIRPVEPPVITLPAQVKCTATLLNMRMGAGPGLAVAGQLELNDVVTAKELSPNEAYYGFAWDIGGARVYTDINVSTESRLWGARAYLEIVSTPPPAEQRNYRKWGLHCMYSMASQLAGEPDGAVDLAYKLGARVFNTINIGPDGWIKQAKKYPDALFICREAQERGFLPDVVELANKFGLSSAWPANCIIVGLNEDDNGVPFSSVDGMRERHAWDVNFYTEVKRRAPNVKYAASIYPPTDKPDEKALADTFKSTYVPSFNSRVDFWFDYHNYSPNETSLWSVNPDGEPDTLYYEMRATFALRHGSNPMAVGNRIIYSESGMDKGGVGGFNQLQFTDQQFLEWARRHDELHKQYGLDVAVIGGTFFQLCDSQLPPIGRGGGTQAKWWGYEMFGLDDGLKALYAGRQSL